MDEQIKVNDFFNEVVCINLEVREDRRLATNAEMSKYNIDFGYVQAKGPIQGHRINPGEAGAFLSHFEVLQYAANSRLDNILVLEDDVELADDFDWHFDMNIRKVPKDWDMIYFGGNHEDPPEVLEDGLLKCTRTFAIHCVGIRWSAYAPLINACMANQFSVPIDYLYAELHKHMNVYAFSPAMAFQRVGYSDIQNSVVDYTILREGYNAVKE